jgi:hypothetical protein
MEISASRKASLSGLAAGREEVRKELVLKEGAQVISHSQVQIPLGEGGPCDAGGYFWDRTN